MITPQCFEKVLSNNAFFGTRIQRLLDILFFCQKGPGVHVQRLLKMRRVYTRVYTLGEILIKIFGKKRR